MITEANAPNNAVIHRLIDLIDAASDLRQTADEHGVDLRRMPAAVGDIARAAADLIQDLDNLEAEAQARLDDV